jgi:glucosamine--fructose-6-phosphate aminotransferase (isomerizing)
MCGILGIIGKAAVAPLLLDGLKRLEYRGYDSAGIATLVNGHIARRRAEGKLGNLEALLARDPLAGTIGIGHTRWATHGRPNETNAHPHATDRVAVVHNGIIENFDELRRELTALGHKFETETDTEVVAHLLTRYLQEQKTPEQAMAAAMARLHGAFALAVIFAGRHDLMIGARRGSPLAVGYGDGEMYLGSDALSLASLTRRICYLEEDDWVVISAADARVFNDGKRVERAVTQTALSGALIGKGNYPHFMLKEICEQPDVVANTMRDRVDVATGEIRIPELGLRDHDLIGLNRLCFVACGTSWHAALAGKYLVEEFARLPVEVDLASEFRYRRPVLDGRVLTVPISQSGETADTLAALRTAKELGSRVVAISNVVGSSIAREADGVLYARAGLEIGVASTKAFAAQLAAVSLLALRLGLARGMAEPELIAGVVKALWQVPELIETVLEQSDEIRAAAARFADRPSMLYLGRGLHYPLALEGALKLKEISYIHAEGYAAGEMKHGPIALVDRQVPVVAIAPPGPTYDKMASNIEEVKARDGVVIALASEGDEEIASKADVVIPIPPALYWVQPLVVAPALQLWAYHLGVLRGADVDQPRNLAKSVTVE